MGRPLVEARSNLEFGMRFFPAVPTPLRLVPSIPRAPQACTCNADVRRQLFAQNTGTSLEHAPGVIESLPQTKLRGLDWEVSDDNLIERRIASLKPLLA